MKTVASRSAKLLFLVLSLVYFAVGGIARDFEYFPDGRVIITGCCFYKARPEHVVEVNWSLNDENLIVPDVVVRNSSSFWELQIDSLPEKYNNSIIQCTVSIANQTICETQWCLLAKDVTTTQPPSLAATNNTSPSPATGNSTTPGLNPTTGSSPPHLGKNSIMSMVIPVVVVMVVVVVVVVAYIIRKREKEKTGKKATQETYDNDNEKDGISLGIGKPRRRTRVKRSSQDEGDFGSSDENTAGSVKEFTAEVSDSDLPSSAVQSGQAECIQMSVDIPVRVYVGGNGLEVK